ncbi:LysM peptidoglycan-binding domain-containing protein [Bacillus sinesaloumensis]|uniref:LysM peptidoglycan-binding domain-containing protein n=1 Tax=Litchfieldia sinesaloumensis TaxID=1926280 RepID=UPI000988476A|nr:LysM peptidoglycan-binding domain-containing protein [Bacillus sinesaloumensis]
MVKYLQPFTHYKINENEDGCEVILYVDENLTEFSSELGTSLKIEETNMKVVAKRFVKRMFPTLKVKTVKIMAGGVLLSTLGLGTLPVTQASAAEPSIKKTQTNSTSYTVSSGDTLYSIALKNGTTVDAIKKANNLSSNLLKIGQILIIPIDPAVTPIQPNGQTYQVVTGDTLYSIAQQNGTTVDAIKAANNLTSNLLSIGQTLKIPTGQASPTQSNVGTHQVVSGDTLYNIAKRNGTTVDAVKKANNLSSDVLSIGQTLTIPTGLATPTQTNGTSHKVTSGDTLYSIAQRNGTTVDAIKAANNLSSDVLSIGQILTIPNGVSVAPAETPLTAKQETVENQEEVEWLAKMIHSEAKGESFEGQVAVGAVIMNRVKSPLFPNSVKEVLFEKSYGYYQFTPAETGIINTAKPTEQNREAAKRALNGEDPTNGALFFYNPDKTSSTYLRSRTVSTTIGNHVFAF